MSDIKIPAEWIEEIEKKPDIFKLSESDYEIIDEFILRYYKTKTRKDIHAILNKTYPKIKPSWVRDRVARLKKEL